MEKREVPQGAKLSAAQKRSNGHAWYKDHIDRLGVEHYDSLNHTGGKTSRKYNMQINYDLYNNILNMSDLQYVTNPVSKDSELPAKLENRDIFSTKIKAILGMEIKRPFPWKILATNSEANTRKETESYERNRKYVVDKLMQPIRLQAEKKYQEQQKGRELSPQELEQMNAQMEQEIEQNSPANVKKYMERDHKDFMEILNTHLLNYLKQQLKLDEKFNLMFKHLNLSAYEIGYVGEFNGEPDFWVVDPRKFTYDRSSNTDMIHEADWATCEYNMSLNEIAQYFTLTNKEIEELHVDFHRDYDDRIKTQLFSNPNLNNEDDGKITVIHAVWKALREIKFLKYQDETGEIQERYVPETYQLDTTNGDISVDTLHVVEVYEGWRLGKDIYKNMRPIPGQFKDPDNIHKSHLPYYGATSDSTNSVPTCIADRMKQDQYFYNIIIFRLEQIMASDKGKKVLMNYKYVPDEIGIENWQHYFESSPYVWYDDTAEGMVQTNRIDAGSVAKVIDLSTASDMTRYVTLAEFFKKRIGDTTGITDVVEGQGHAREAVSNTQQKLVQTSNVLEPYFALHDKVKKEILSAILNKARVVYSKNKPKKLSYFLDDQTVQIFELDGEILDNETVGLFVTDNSKIDEIKQTINQLTHAAVQNQQIDLSAVTKVMRQESLVEAEETLRAAEEEKRKVTEAFEMQKGQQQEEFNKAAFEREKELIILKEEEKRKTAVVTASLTGASFNPDKDGDGDGINDFIEIAREGLDAEIKANAAGLEREKFEHAKEMDKEKVRQTDIELEIKGREKREKKL